jgi:hypothetical protein
VDGRTSLNFTAQSSDTRNPVEASRDKQTYVVLSTAESRPSCARADRNSVVNADFDIALGKRSGVRIFNFQEPNVCIARGSLVARRNARTEAIFRRTVVGAQLGSSAILDRRSRMIFDVSGCPDKEAENCAKSFS